MPAWPPRKFPTFDGVLGGLRVDALNPTNRPSCATRIPTGEEDEERDINSISSCGPNLDPPL